MNLFWKIWLGFWLYLLLMALGAVSMVRLYDEARLQNPDQVADNKRTGFIIEATVRALQEGGIQQLKRMIDILPLPSEDREPRRPSTGQALGYPAAREPMPQPPSGEQPAPREQQRPMPPGPAPRDPNQPRHPIPLVVNAQGQDLLGRTVPLQAWHQAISMVNPISQAPDARSPVRQVQLPDGQQVTVFMLNRMLPPEGNLLFGIFETPLLLPLSALLASLIFSGLLARYLVRPIRILRDGLRQIASGQFDVTMRRQMGNRRDELGELGQDADKMAQQLKQLLSTQRRLLHDISHDLRSPLARLQVAIGLVRQSPERLPEMLERLEHETMRLDGMIGEVLTLARLGRNVPFAYNRKEAKDHGEGGTLVGAPLKGRVLIVDDVMSAGTAARESIALIKAAGATPHAVAIALDRQEKATENGVDVEHSAVQYVRNQLGMQVCAIAKLADLLLYLSKNGGAEMRVHHERVFAYRQKYGVTEG